MLFEIVRHNYEMLSHYFEIVSHYNDLNDLYVFHRKWRKWNGVSIVFLREWHLCPRHDLWPVPFSVTCYVMTSEAERESGPLVRTVLGGGGGGGGGGAGAAAAARWTSVSSNSLLSPRCECNIYIVVLFFPPGCFYRQLVPLCDPRGASVLREKSRKESVSIFHRISSSVDREPESVTAAHWRHRPAPN